MSYPVSYNTL